MSAHLERIFKSRFGEPAQGTVRAPGRVNLIGEHTDYNDGFVLPMAIDREVRIAFAPSSDGKVRIYSVDLDAEIEFVPSELGQPTENAGRGWGEYPKGVAWALQEAGVGLPGFDAAMSGNVPRGAGLSSSAAVELAVARAFWAVGEFDWDPAEMALLCQRAENQWLGVASGIMDQLTSAAAQEGDALLIDCRSLERKPVPLPPGTAVLVLDTGTRRKLAASAYNERRRGCEEAAWLLGAKSLRDVTLDQLEANIALVPDVLYRRARHVLSENARTLAAAGAMERGDPIEVGRLMNESHYSLRDDFEVSSLALDAIAEVARSSEGCYGARLTGAGFGGCAVALVDEKAADRIAEEVGEGYRKETNLEASIYLCRPAAGASGPLSTPSRSSSST